MEFIMPKKKLTQKRLKELLHYDPLTGIPTWKADRQCVGVGDIAGSKDKDGYIVIKVDYKSYKAHRLAWLYVYGYFPENDLDHIDRIKHHNWISNLRETSKQCNARNTGNPKDNNSGVKGVGWRRANKKWQVRININQKLKYLGYYKSFCEAVCTRLAAEQCLDWVNCDSSSPAYQYVQKMLKDKGETK